MRNSSDTLDASLRSLTLDASLRSLTRDASDEQNTLIFSESWDRILEMGRAVQGGHVSKHSEASNVTRDTRREQEDPAPRLSSYSSSSLALHEEFTTKRIKWQQIRPQRLSEELESRSARLLPIVFHQRTGVTRVSRAGRRALYPFPYVNLTYPLHKLCSAGQFT